MKDNSRAKESLQKSSFCGLFKVTRTYHKENKGGVIMSTVFSATFIWFGQLCVVSTVFIFILPLCLACVIHDHPWENMQAPLEIWRHARKELGNLLPLRRFALDMGGLIVRHTMRLNIVGWSSAQSYQGRSS